MDAEIRVRRFWGLVLCFSGQCQRLADTPAEATCSTTRDWCSASISISTASRRKQRGLSYSTRNMFRWIQRRCIGTICVVGSGWRCDKATLLPDAYHPSTLTRFFLTPAKHSLDLWAIKPLCLHHFLCSMYRSLWLGGVQCSLRHSRLGPNLDQQRCAPSREVDISENIRLQRPIRRVLAEKHIDIERLVCVTYWTARFSSCRLGICGYLPKNCHHYYNSPVLYPVPAPRDGVKTVGQLNVCGCRVCLRCRGPMHASACCSYAYTIRALRDGRSKDRYCEVYRNSSYRHGHI